MSAFGFCFLFVWKWLRHSACIEKCIRKWKKKLNRFVPFKWIEIATLKPRVRITVFFLFLAVEMCLFTYTHIFEHETLSAMSTYFTLIHVVNHEIHNQPNVANVYHPIHRIQSLLKWIRSALVFPYHFCALHSAVHTYTWTTQAIHTNSNRHELK